MPIYEYSCEKCGQQSEIYVKSRDDSPRCPKCGGEKLKKLLSAFAAPGGDKPHAHTGGGCSCCPANASCPSGKKY